MEFSGGIIGDETGSKVRNDIANKLVGELRDLISKKYIANQNLGIWEEVSGAAEIDMSGEFYFQVCLNVANWICQKKLNIGKSFCDQCLRYLQPNFPFRNGSFQNGTISNLLFAIY